VDAEVARFDPSAPAAADTPRVIVGTWAEAGRDGTAAQLGDGPATSGVFARFVPAGAGRYALEELDRHGDAARRVGERAGLVAALRDGDDPPTWLVTGTDRAGVRAAAALLRPDDLRDRYAVAVAGGRASALPLSDPEAASG
jgi:hypothetical protein